MNCSKEMYFFKISDNINNESFNNLLQFVSAEKAQQIKTLRRHMDKKLSLYAQLAVKVIARNKYNISLQDLEITADSNGKPYFKKYPQIHFNISHSNNAVAIAFSDRAVGIDTEQVMDCNMKIAKRFFTKEEIEYLENSSNPSIAFTKIWTQKEAYIKAVGEGLAIALDSFCVLNDPLYNRFNTVSVEDFIISYYDGEINNLIPICLTEEEIENEIKH